MYLAVGAGGMVGAIIRFIIYRSFIRAEIPLTGTLCVNLSGCFFLGYLQGLARVHKLPDWLVVGIGTGLIGAYTTFSTFSAEVVSYFAKGIFFLPICYLLASSIGGYILVYLGFVLANNKMKDG